MFDRRTWIPLDVNRPLKGQVIVRTHTGESRNRGIDGFKIHKIERVPERFKFGFQFFTKPRLTCLHRDTGVPLNLAQLEISVYLVDGFDPHLLKLLDCTGMESWNVADVVFRLGMIAVIKELADNRVDAMRPCGNVGRLGYG